ATDALAEFDAAKKFEPTTAKAVETFLADAATGPAKEVALTSANAMARPRPNQPAQQAVPAPHTGAPAPVRIIRYHGSKGLLIECQDKGQAQPSVVHRSYIAK